MALQDILRAQSIWTWDVIRASMALGEVVREDALTSVNLAMIYNEVQSQGIPLQITSMQGANLEKEFGADWYWTVPGKGQLIQAKKLDMAKRVDMMSYSINVPQLNELLLQANLMSARFGMVVDPLYVFFNSCIPDVNAADFGCTAYSATAISNKIIADGKQLQKSVTIAYSDLADDLVPWYTLF